MNRSPQPDLGILVLLAYQNFVLELRASLAEDGFGEQGRSDGYVFRALAHRPMTVSALAERLGVSKQAAGQIVDDMERRGYLERRPDPEDGRARLVDLSARGRATLAAARRFHQRTEQRLRRIHGQPALDTLRAVLGTMSGDAGSDDGDEPVDPVVRALYL